MKTFNYQSIKSFCVTAAMSCSLFLSGSAMAGFCDWIPICAEFDVSGIEDIYEENIYSGTNCKPAYASRWDDFEAKIGEFRNKSSRAQSVVCPFVRHYTEKGHFPRHFAVEVYNPSTNYLGCTVYAMNGVGYSVDSESVSTRASGKQFLTNNRYISANRYAGEYVMYCSLPAGAKILNYKIHERLGYK